MLETILIDLKGSVKFASALSIRRNEKLMTCVVWTQQNTENCVRVRVHDAIMKAILHD